MAPHSSTLAWQIPRMEEPGRLQSMGSLWVGHDWATSLWLFTFVHWRRQWQPTPVFLPGESQGQGSLVGRVSGVAESDTTEATQQQHLLYLPLLSFSNSNPSIRKQFLSPLSPFQVFFTLLEPKLKFISFPKPTRIGLEADEFQAFSSSTLRLDFPWDQPSHLISIPFHYLLSFLHAFLIIK